MILAVVEDLWRWHPHVDTWLLVGTILWGYFYALRRHGGINQSATNREIAAFLCGTAVIWVASDYPLHDFAERYLFSVHMVQHLLITLVAPPLLIAGMPDWMMRKLFCGKRMLPIAKFFFAPLVAGILYNVVTVAAHWPVVVNAALEHHFLHFWIHIVLFTSAWAMWMPVFNKLPELPRMSALMKMVYLFLMSVLPTVPAAFITFSTTPVYSFYANAPRIWQDFTAVDDQQLAGAIMKVIGGGFLWTVIIVIFFGWYSSERDSKNHYDSIDTKTQRSSSSSV